MREHDPRGSNQFIGLIRLPNRFPREIIRGILLPPSFSRKEEEERENRRRRRRRRGPLFDLRSHPPLSSSPFHPSVTPRHSTLFPARLYSHANGVVAITVTCSAFNRCRGSFLSHDNVRGHLRPCALITRRSIRTRDRSEQEDDDPRCSVPSSSSNKKFRKKWVVASAWLEGWLKRETSLIVIDLLDTTIVDHCSKSSNDF